MLIEQTLDKLTAMKLGAMADPPGVRADRGVDQAARGRCQGTDTIRAEIHCKDSA